MYGLDALATPSRGLHDGMHLKDGKSRDDEKSNKNLDENLAAKAPTWSPTLFNATCLNNSNFSVSGMVCLLSLGPVIQTARVQESRC